MHVLSAHILSFKRHCIVCHISGARYEYFTVCMMTVAGQEHFQLVVSEDQETAV